MLEKIPTQSCGDDSDTESLDAVGPMVIIENMGGGGDLFDPVAEHHLLHLNDSSFDDDFSEYMWMLNEEEFDKEEMQRLEEEALMEQCIEAMFDLERAHRRAMDEGRQLVLPDELVDGEARPINADGSEVSQELCKVLSLLKLNGADINPASVAMELPVSLLNPLAEEFVPAELPAATMASTSNGSST